MLFACIYPVVALCMLTWADSGQQKILDVLCLSRSLVLTPCDPIKTLYFGTLSSTNQKLPFLVTTKLPDFSLISRNTLNSEKTLSNDLLDRALNRPRNYLVFEPFFPNQLRPRLDCQETGELNKNCINFQADISRFGLAYFTLPKAAPELRLGLINNWEKVRLFRTRPFTRHKMSRIWLN